MGRPAQRASVIALLSAIAACGGESPIEPGPETGPLTAYIDGEAFVAESATAQNQVTVVLVTATGGDISFRFEFPDRGVSNYVIGAGNPVVAELTVGSSTWRADEAAGAGTITVFEFVPGFMSGQFDLTLVGGPDGSTVRVTTGRFAIIG